MSYKTLFEKTPPLKLFFKAAIPGSIGMLAAAFYLFLDGILISRLVGETAFAAFNLAIPLVVMNFAIADLVGVGSSVAISILLGKKEEEEASNIFSIACLLIVGVGTFIGLILYILAPLLLKSMGASGELLRQSVLYLRIYAIYSPVTTIVFAMDNYLRICGKIKFSMFLNIFMSLLCCTLEIIFLYFFKWGIAGAGLATCTGFFISALVAFYPFIRRKVQLYLKKPHFNFEILKTILKNGTPVFLNNIAGRLTSIILNMALLYMGGASAVTIYGILMCVDSFILPLLYGMCDALQPAVGYNWGAKNYSRVNAIERCCFSASAVLSITTGLIVFFFPELIASLFIHSENTELFNMAVHALPLFAITYFTRWVSFASQSFMSAIGKAVLASSISIAMAFIFPLLTMAILWNFKLTGLWLNTSLASFLTGVLSIVILIKFYKYEG